MRRAGIDLTVAGMANGEYRMANGGFQLDPLLDTLDLLSAAKQPREERPLVVLDQGLQPLSIFWGQAHHDLASHLPFVSSSSSLQ